MHHCRLGSNRVETADWWPMQARGPETFKRRLCGLGRSPSGLRPSPKRRTCSLGTSRFGRAPLLLRT
eukprot:10256816-Alexandrium_andersonii.AAC.1